jgi:hypothetical protein
VHCSQQQEAAHCSASLPTSRHRPELQDMSTSAAQEASYAKSGGCCSWAHHWECWTNQSRPYKYHAPKGAHACEVAVRSSSSSLHTQGSTRSSPQTDLVCMSAEVEQPPAAHVLGRHTVSHTPPAFNAGPFRMRPNHPRPKSVIGVMYVDERGCFPGPAHILHIKVPQLTIPVDCKGDNRWRSACDMQSAKDVELCADVQRCSACLSLGPSAHQERRTAAISKAGQLIRRAGLCCSHMAAMWEAAELHLSHDRPAVLQITELYSHICTLIPPWRLQKHQARFGKRDKSAGR